MFRRGWVFKDDKLLMFEEDSVLVLRGWSVCRAWQKTESTGWTAIRPQGPLIRSIWSTSRPRYVERWKDEPDEQQAHRPPAPERSGAPLHRALPSGSVARGQALPRAAVARAVAGRALPGRAGSRAGQPRPGLRARIELGVPQAAGEAADARARALVGKKRTAILEALGFPASPRSRACWRRSRGGRSRVQSLLYLRATLLAPDPPKALHHLPRLDAGVLRILCDPALSALSTWSLLEEVARERPSTQRAAYLLRDTAAMHRRCLARRLARSARSRGWSSCTTSSRRSSRSAASGSTATPELPPPPLPAGPGIEPLRRARTSSRRGRRCGTAWAATSSAWRGHRLHLSRHRAGARHAERALDAARLEGRPAERLRQCARSYATLQA